MVVIVEKVYIRVIHGVIIVAITMWIVAYITCIKKG